MAEHNLQALLQSIPEPTTIVGDPTRLMVADITNDSRTVSDGALYVALHGLHTDGHRYVPDAIRRGATAVLHEDPLSNYDPTVVYIRSAEPRMAMSALADAFFDRPSASLQVIGVTGTDGKTTTTTFIHQLLEALGEPAGFLSTAGMKVDAGATPNRLHQSTPEAPEVHRILAKMVGAGRRYAVLESTSHGLSHRTARLAHVRYRAAVFTNLGHEHLEFHGSFEQYGNDKANLFRQLQPDGVGVVNRASPHANLFTQAAAARVVEYAVTEDESAELSANLAGRVTDTGPAHTQIALSWAGGSATVRLPMPGAFNAENALAALLTVAEVTGRPVEELASLLNRLTGPVGRMQVITAEPFTVVVDYAHTPGSFERVFPLFRKTAHQRLIAVFGSAGERDVAKRPIQGGIAARYADLVVLADEDPRGEDRMEILREIAAGCDGLEEGSSLFLIPDRRSAIRHAFALAHPGDVVLLLGKGHEASIIGAEQSDPWDEAAVAREELEHL